MNMEKLNLKRRWVSQLFLVVTICTLAVCAEIQDLRSSDIKQRESAADKIEKERKVLISQLIELTKEEMILSSNDSLDFSEENPWHGSKHLAILALGEYRAIEAIPILIENIEYRNPRSLFVFSYQEQDFMCPAVEALGKIGMPAIDPVIEKLGTYDKESQGRKNCVWIIQKVLGIKLGRYKLKLAIEETKDEKVKKNLQAVLPVFKTLQEQLNEERTRRDKEKQKQK